LAGGEGALEARQVSKREDCIPPLLDPSVPWPPPGWVRVEGEKMTEKTENEHNVRPFLKIVGGKRVLLPEILPRLPAKIKTYYEPFLGGGAVFFALAAEKRFEKAVLGDANHDFMRTYAALARDVDGVIHALKKHVYNEKRYYAVRAQDPRKLESIVRAARVIYLNKTGFNGLYRVNRKGEFNVPFGRYTNPTICDEENLRAVAAVLHRRSVSLVGSDFEKTVAPAKRGDTVYFDCPYAPMSETANFTAYTADGFGSAEQERLRDVARKLIDRGVHVLLSNSDTPFVRHLYKGFKLEKVQAPRRVNSKGNKRGNVGELLISGKK
jgi:DNA adenine methylase